MSKLTMWVAVAGLGALLAPAYALASPACCGAGAKQALCPVSGKPADLSVRADTDAGPVFFCCKGCVGPYEAEPAKFSKQVEQQRSALATLPKVQKTCPVSGKPVKDDVAIEHEGQTVRFCCDQCPAAFKKDPAKFAGKLAASYEYLKPAACPVSGQPVNFAVRSDTKEGPVYFCCKGCVGKYEAETAKYEAKVAEQRKTLSATPRIQVTCPLTGKPVKEGVATSKGGTKVQFCCPGCKEKYEADPAAYQAKLEGSYSYQTICPVMGEEIDPTSFAELASGQKVYFCCDGCGKKLFADPAKYAPKLEAQGLKIPASDIKPKKS